MNKNCPSKANSKYSQPFANTFSRTHTPTDIHRRAQTFMEAEESESDGRKLIAADRDAQRLAESDGSGPSRLTETTRGCPDGRRLAEATKDGLRRTEQQK